MMHVIFLLAVVPLIIEVRDYQIKMRDAAREMLRTVRGIILQMATGSGKTVVAADIIKRAVAMGKRVLFIAHRVELLTQASDKLKTFGVPHALIKAGRHGNIMMPVQVASIQTLARRIKDIPFVPDLIVCDEFHLAAAKSYADTFNYYADPAIRKTPPVIIGLSATPSRLDGKGLGRQNGGHIDRIIPGPSMDELIALGFLVPLRYFSSAVLPDLSGVGTVAGDYNQGKLETAVDKHTITGNVVEHWLELAKGRKTIVFCVSIKHGDHVAAQFRDAGINAISVNGTWDEDVRARALKDVEFGSVDVLVNCALYTEGLDLPIVSCIADLAPTQSITRYLQRAGRGMRPFPGKIDCIYLDAGNNFSRFGLPNEPREWSLDGAESKKKSAERALSVRVCQKCLCAQKSGRPTCTNCGFAFPVEGRKVKEKEGKLKEITAADIARNRERQQMGMTKDYQGLVAFGRRKAFKDPEGWAAHVIAGREAKKAKRNADWIKAGT